MSRLFFFIIFFLYSSLFAEMSQFMDKATALIQKDFPEKEIRLNFDYPEVFSKLPQESDVIGYKDLGNGRVQLICKGFEKLITGKIEVMTSVPVLSKPLSPGSIIGEDDVILQKLPTNQIQGASILKKEDLIGKKTKHKITQAFAPIQQSEVEAPIVIKRDALVRLHYITGNVHLTAQARALKDGAIAQRISFEVMGKSKKHIDATVIDGNTAEIRITS